VEKLFTKTDSDENLKYEFFDVTADVGFKAYGDTLDMAFGNAAIAMFEVITDTSTIEHRIIKKIKLEAEDECSTLYEWLSELLFIHDTENLVFSKFNVKIYQKLRKEKKMFYLEALAFGEKFNQEVHEKRSEVKAVTYHMMEVNLEDNCNLQVILDI
jgi:SHS2 domain-containing protein